MPKIWKKFKINSVICKVNFMEDMIDAIEELNPERWKVFMMLLIKGENDENSEAKELAITEEQFKTFIDKHKNVKSLVEESNDTMRNSYIILDEKLRFLNCSNGGKDPTPSILDVGVKKAYSMIFHDHNMFINRKGIYDWARDDSKCSNSSKTVPQW